MPPTIWVATVLTVYGIETIILVYWILSYKGVATVLTVYGIETVSARSRSPALPRLQQYLPFTVLKRGRTAETTLARTTQLQQYLPFTVLKPE